MTKESFYFSHDFNSRNDEKILKIRTKFKNAEGYGIFWMVAEAMAESSDGSIDSQAMAELSFSFNLPTQLLTDFINYGIEIGLFIKSEDRITSKRIQDHKHFRKGLSDAGKEGAARRWPSHSQAIATPMLKKGKEKKRKEIKRKENSSMAYVAFEQATLTAWNQFCSKFPALSSIKELSDKRRDKLKVRFEKQSFKDFNSILTAFEQQRFLFGENERKWRASFDWLIENDTNYLKVLEKKYLNHETESDIVKIKEKYKL